MRVCLLSLSFSHLYHKIFTDTVRDLAGSIAGGVIGAFFLVAAIIIVACFYKRSRPVSSPRLKIQL